MIAYHTAVLKPFLARYGDLQAYVMEQHKLGTEAVYEQQEGIFVLTEYADPELPKLAMPFAAKDIVIIDKRPFIDKRGNLTKNTEWNFMSRLAKFEYLWINMPDAFTPIIPQLCSVYGSWISQVVAGRFSATLDDAERVRVLAGCAFYASILKMQGETLPQGDELAALYLRFSANKLRMPVRQAELLFTGEWAENMGSAGIEDMVSNIVNATDSPAIRMDTSTLFALASTGSWYGNDSDIVCLAAMEHPPTLLTLIEAALSSTAYRKTRIGMVVNSLKRPARLDAIESWIKKLN